MLDLASVFRTPSAHCRSPIVSHCAPAAFERMNHAKALLENGSATALICSRISARAPGLGIYWLVWPRREPGV